MDIKLAKEQGLNWQALLIEETQTRIKKTIKDMLLAGMPNVLIVNEVNKLIKECGDGLEIPDLADRTRQGLSIFANKVFIILSSAYGGLLLNQVRALSQMAVGKATPQQVEIVKEIVDKDQSVFAEWRVPLDEYSKDYMKRIEERVNVVAKLEGKEDYKDRLTLRNLAEIQVRQEKHIQEIQNYIDNGINLIWIVPHANCSERCQKYQGKLYSLDKTSGTIDGINYEPLENATDKYETTKNGKTYKNGCLSGFNCRHTTKPYKKGYKPNEIPASVIERAREIDKTQRYLERGVRSWRDKAIMYKGNNPKAYKFAKAKAEEWNARYIEYSKENKVAFYPSRTKLI